MEIILPNIESKKPYTLYSFIIILPFLLLYWMMPFVTDLTLGADYQIFSINEQLETLFSIKTGSFPLYMPGYKFGHSSSALTLSQVYHPISHIASWLPGYWNGKALEWNTFLRLLSLGFVHLMLFAFLRKIKLNILFSFLLSLITVYNLRMLEAFRYGASLEAYTAHLLLCSLIGGHFINPRKWLGPLSIIGATYLLVCSGHPPMMFYGLFGAIVFTLVAPFFIAAMLPEIDVSFKAALGFCTKVGFYICLGILLSSAYLIPFYIEFVTTNVEYAHQGIQSHMGQDTFIGALNNFFMPFASDVLSSFGGSSLILIALFLPVLRFFKVKIPPAIWAIWGILLIAFLYILGPQTPVVIWAWEYIPFVSSAGGVGRIAIIIPVFLMLLMAWIINVGPFEISVKDRSVKLAPYIFLGLIALVLIPVYLLPVFLLKPALGYFTPHFIRKIPFWIEAISVFWGMASLSALILYGIYPRLSRVLGMLLCLMIILQIGTILTYGTFIEKKIDNPTLEQIKTHKKERLDFNYHQNPGLFHSVVLSHLKRSFVEPFLGKIYTQTIPVSGQDDAYQTMERERLPQQIFIEGYDPGKARAITEKGSTVKEGEVELEFSAFNMLRFRVFSPAPAFFGMAYPFTGHWKAWINGKSVSVYRANGAAHAIEIHEGESVIEFRYWSDAFFWGVVISCAMFAAIGGFVCFRAVNGLSSIIGVSILTISLGGFMLWYNSLYTGDNLETRYTWSYTPPLITPNIAYGKNTVSRYRKDSGMLLYHGSAVDGNTERGSGVSISPSDEALLVDLTQPLEIKTIVLYGKFDALPEISFSQDKLQWQTVSHEHAVDRNSVPLYISVQKPQLVRYIKVKAIDSALEIDELEVYGPEKVL